MQAVLSGRLPSTTPQQRARPDFPLRAFVRCKSCGRGLTGSWSKGRGLFTRNVASQRRDRNRILDSARRQSLVARQEVRWWREGTRDGSARCEGSVQRCGQRGERGRRGSDRCSSALEDWHFSECRRVACLRACEGEGNVSAEPLERKTRRNEYRPTPMAAFAIRRAVIACKIRDAWAIGRNPGPNRRLGGGWLAEPKLVQRRTGPPSRRPATLRRGILRLHS